MRVCRLWVYVVTGVAALCLSLLLGACGNTGVVDLAPLGTFLDLHVKNDTAKTVTIADCWGSRCTRDVGSGFNDRLRPHGQRDEAAWLNATAGVARVRVSSAGKTLGCFIVRYRKGQEHATALVSEAASCIT